MCGKRSCLHFSVVETSHNCMSGVHVYELEPVT